MSEINENAAKNTHNVIEELLLLSKSTGKLDDMKVLDLPCGEGAFTQRIMRNGIKVIPCDIVNILYTSEVNNFTIVDMDDKLPFDNNLFTDIVCIDGIEHIEKQFDFIRECNRVLRLSGRLIISTPNISSTRSRWRYFLTGHHNKCKSPLNEKNITHLHHKNMISFPELRYILHTNGFEIENVTTNRIKTISWIYAIVYPFLYIATSVVYMKEEKDKAQRKRNREIKKVMFSRSVYFGETLILLAKKTHDLTNRANGRS